jgi:hypothetical protein
MLLLMSAATMNSRWSRESSAQRKKGGHRYICTCSCNRRLLYPCVHVRLWLAESNAWACECLFSDPLPMSPLFPSERFVLWDESIGAHSAGGMLTWSCCRWNGRSFVCSPHQLAWLVCPNRHLHSPLSLGGSSSSKVLLRPRL